MASALAILLSLAALGVVGASLWYVAFRLQVLLGGTRPWRFRLAVALGFFAAFASVATAPRYESTVVGWLYLLSGYALTAFLFLLLVLLALHLLRRNRALPDRRSAFLAVAVAMAVTTAGAVWALRFSVRETSIPLRDLEREVRVAHLSDVHLGHHRGRAYLERIVEETNRQKPDLVVITGDLLDARSAFLPGTLEPLAGFDAPVFYVGGNHEKDVDAARAFELVARQGVRVLHNEVVDTHGLQLVGLDYMKPDDDTFDMHPSDDKRTIRSVLPGLALRRESPSVLLHHSPVGTRYAADAGVDLVLAGHTHGGQVFPFDLFAEVIFPFTRGLHRVGETQVFVSEGIGTFMARVRLGTSNTLHLLRLQPETGSSPEGTP